VQQLILIQDGAVVSWPAGASKPKTNLSKEQEDKLRADAGRVVKLYALFSLVVYGKVW
jgi:hypothetical protein